jgi:hypothetical protein
MNYQAIWIGLGLSLGVATAAPVPAPDRLLPADTLLLVTVPDCQAAATGWQQHPLHRFWNDPAMGPFRDKLTATVRREWITPLETELGHPLTEITGLLRGQLTLALVQNGWPDQRGRRPAFLVFADTGDRAERMGEFLGEWRKHLEESGTPVKAEPIGNRDFFSVQLSTDGLGTGVGSLTQEKTDLLIGQSGSLVVMGTERNVIEQVLARQSEESATGSSLGDHGLFRQDFEAGLRGTHGYAWMNLQPLLGYLRGLAQAQEAQGQGAIALLQPTKLMSATGLNGLRSLAVGAQLASDGSRVEVLVGLPESERTGLMKLLVPEAKDATPPAFVPADVARFQRMRINLPQAWNAFEEIVFTILPTARGVIDMMFFSVGKDQDPNFDLRRELFGNLGDDVIVMEKAPAQETLAALSSPPTLILLGANAPDRAAAALKALAGLLPPPLNQLEERLVDGRRLYNLQLPPMGESPDAITTLGFVGGDGYLAVSMEPDLLRDFARNQPLDGPKLMDLPGLRDAAARVGGMSNGLFGYENDRLTAKTMLEALRNDAGLIEQMLAMTPLAEQLDGSEGRRMSDWVDFSLLPSFDRVEKHFHFSLYGVAVRPEGVTYRLFTPTPQ